MMRKGCERDVALKIQYFSSDASLTQLLKNLQICMLYVLFNKHEMTIIFRRE